eukprot:NODE_45_length_2444_cov_513.517790.p1 GENE.NODE_45_length_2444_cov_513.517790~~NODE_45_length_2444_cov_513.517790.p1  ORF type:complete len:704 (-),score=330.21 NODE_45_length_2444_cov_513.517790:315-2426(-)
MGAQAIWIKTWIEAYAGAPKKEVHWHSMAAKVVTLLCILAVASANDSSPVKKVLQLLADLQEKINKEGAAAAANHKEFLAFCEEREANLGNEIETGEAEIADLKAEIERAAAKMEAHKTEIEKHAASVATNEEDLKSATEVRDKERAEFEAEEQDAVKTISALERAIGILEKEARKGGASAVQIERATNVAAVIGTLVEASMLGAQDASTLTELLQSAEGHAPEAASYESHSGSILDTLADLLEKARAQLAVARQKEEAATRNFHMLKQSLEDGIRFANKDLGEARANLNAHTDKKTVAEDELRMTSKVLAENRKALAAHTHDCVSRTEDYEAEVKSRNEELGALAGAEKVVTEMTTGAKSLTYSMDQTSFLQQSKLTSAVDLANFEVVQFVRKLAREQKSEALAQLARRISRVIQEGSASGSDPFAKVKGLIKALIDRLSKEAGEDAAHKAYCDKELAHNGEKKGNMDADVKKLTSKIDSMVARAATLKEQVAELQKSLASVAKTQTEMDRLRKTEHARFKQEKAEMESGIEGTKIALKLLRDYYAKQDAAHDAADGSATGIIGMLEVIESDFTAGLAEIIAAEKAAQEEYEEVTKENEVETETKEQDVKYKNKELGQLGKALAEATNDRDSINTELAAVNEYQSRLNEMCIPKAETHESRMARRAAEINGLKEALGILEDEAASLLQRSKGAHHNQELACE